MRFRLIVLAALGIAIAVAAGAWFLQGPDGAGTGSQGSVEKEVWTCSMHPQIRRDGPDDCPICGMDLIRVRSPSSKAARPAAGPKVYTCSMDPQVRLSKPGECPICGMKLIPAKSDTVPGAASDLETAPVAYRELAREIRTVGKLDYNERMVADITARIDGRVDRLYADFTGIQVKEGDHLVDIYSPKLYQAQNELILALGAYEKAGGSTQELARRTLESARTRLSLWGITAEQLAEIERSRKTTTHLTIYAPIGGTVIEKSVRAGQYVKEGDLMYRIADLDPIWLYLDIYEYDMGWVRYGQAVDVSLEAFPGEVFRGTVTFIDPFLDDTSRTVKVRVNLPNADRRLKPAMYASAAIRVELTAAGSPASTGLEGKYWCPMHPEVVSDKSGRCSICQMALERVPRVSAATSPAKPAGVLSIPVSAVLDTGRRKVTYRLTGDGGVELAEIEVGQRAEDRSGDGPPVAYYPVIKGLKEGERVVICGGFLLDSQRQIEGMPSLFYPGGQSAANLHAGHGSGMEPPKATQAAAGHQH